VDHDVPIAGNVQIPPQIRTAALLIATAIALYLCWLVLRPFLSVITWAMALAIVARPWFGWLERRFGRNLAAFISVFSVAVLLVAPAIWIGQTLVQEINAGLPLLGAQFKPDSIHSKLAPYPLLEAVFTRLEATLNLDEAIRRAAGVLATRASALLGSSIWFITQLFLTLVTLFYFIRDREKLLAVLRGYIPLSEAQRTELFNRISRTINACVCGNVIVKLVQGTLGGLMFWILGLPAPVLFGAAMALFAVLPVFGTSLIWGPAAILLAAGGNWGNALILTFWGLFVVSLIDNILYPVLVAEELRLHALAVFFSILGGLIAFGAAGVILGPVILVVTGALFEVWRLRRSEMPSLLDPAGFPETYNHTMERVP
jgi:predicted PurR-regulated permease PerM